MMVPIKHSARLLKAAMVILALIALNVNCSKDLYTIEQAKQCFHQKAVGACEQITNKCLESQQCQKQLSLFHDCGFEAQEQNQIFNGNCFKNWKQTATHTKPLIQCLDQTCNLADYNSEVGLGILSSCAIEALTTHEIECDPQCQQTLSKIVKERVLSEPIKEIFSDKTKAEEISTNSKANKVMEVIQKECVNQDGQTRKRHQEYILQKKLKKQKLLDRMNKKFKQTPANPSTQL